MCTYLGHKCISGKVEVTMKNTKPNLRFFRVGSSEGPSILGPIVSKFLNTFKFVSVFNEMCMDP